MQKDIREPLVSNEGGFDEDQFLDGKKASVSAIYKITIEELKSLFQEALAGNLQSGLQKFQQLGGLDPTQPGNILDKLASHEMAGIVGDKRDLMRRAKKFGPNTKALKQPASLLASLVQSVKDPVWIVIGISAIISGFMGWIIIGLGGLVEGIAIIITSLFIILITTLADYLQDSQLIKLKGLLLDESVPCIRGQYGQSQSVNIWNLVVGDVIMLEAGARIPGDCLVIDSADLIVEDAGQQQAENEGNFQQQQGKVKSAREDPFLFAGSLIVQGQGKALVCCLGANSTAPGTEQKLDLSAETPLQVKMKNIGGQLKTFGIGSCAVILIVLVIAFFVEMGSTGGETEGAEAAQGLSAVGVLFQKLPQHINLIVVLYVVAVPDGLTLAIGISLAFSIMKMYKQDKILVTKPEAPERIAKVQEICTGKTGTITQNKMKVVEFFVENKVVKNTRRDTLIHCELAEETINRISESIQFNSDARIEMAGNVFTPVGNGTEVALLKFLQDADFKLQFTLSDKYGHVLATSPHTPEKKRSAVVVERPDNPQKVVVYVKGAPEVIISSCKWFTTNKGSQVISGPDRAALAEKVSEMAARPLRVIAVSFLELPKAAWEAYVGKTRQPAGPGLESLLSKNKLEMTLLGLFGLHDPLREGVRQSVLWAKESGMLNVRLVSGDHFQTAAAVALRAGIVKEEDLGNGRACMHADDFRALLARTDKTDEEKFAEIARDLKVLARATSRDKNTLIKVLSNLDRKIAVTGEGINDVDALQLAEVGVVMGRSGCSAAKAAADIILTDDNFSATVEAIKWGRNIFHNLSRFLQFQITVNISALLTVLIGSIYFLESPLSAVQLLWVNLIMDTFAAFALATEPPLKQVISGPPARDQSILSGHVWRQILGVSLWNVLIMIIVFFAAPTMAGFEAYDRTISKNFQLPSEPTEAEAATYELSQNKRRHLTYIYNTFVFLQLFNEINCRKVGGSDRQVFEGLFGNYYFLAVFSGTFCAQIVSVQLLGFLSGTTPLTRQEWGVCMILGATPLLIAFLLKFLPEPLTEKLASIVPIDEGKAKEITLGSMMSGVRGNAAPASNDVPAEVDDLGADPGGYDGQFGGDQRGTYGGDNFPPDNNGMDQVPGDYPEDLEDDGYRRN